jgi:hypothetical protein
MSLCCASVIILASTSFKDLSPVPKLFIAIIIIVCISSCLLITINYLHYDTSNTLATTCSLLAVAAVTLSISPVFITSGAVSNSAVPLALIDFVLNILKVAGDDSASVIVKVIVSALPESSDTSMDLTMAVVKAGAVYSVVALVPVKVFFCICICIRH